MQIAAWYVSELLTSLRAITYVSVLSFKLMQKLVCN